MGNVWERKFERVWGSLKPTVFINRATQTEFDPEWYNYLGFDKDWYDRNWYDKEWYGRDWYDKNWFNKDWWNKDWIYYFTWTEYDNEWFNVNWINKRWFYRSGIHSVTWKKRDSDWYDINDRDENWILREDKEKMKILEGKNMNEWQCPYCAWVWYVDARDWATNWRRITNRKMCNRCLWTGKKGRSPYL